MDAETEREAGERDRRDRRERDRERESVRTCVRDSDQVRVTTTTECVTKKRTITFVFVCRTRVRETQYISSSSSRQTYIRRERENLSWRCSAVVGPSVFLVVIQVLCWQLKLPEKSFTRQKGKKEKRERVREVRMSSTRLLMACEER